MSSGGGGEKEGSIVESLFYRCQTTGGVYTERVGAGDAFKDSDAVDHRNAIAKKMNEASQVDEKGKEN